MRQSIVLAALILLSLPALAQVRVNPKVGVNISALDTKIQDIDAEARVGWNAGLDFRIGEGIFFLQPGIHYYSFTARLFQDVSPDTDVDLREETTIQTLRAPVNLGLRLTGDDGLIGLHLKGGVVPAYVLSVKEKPVFQLDREDLRDFTLGANIGAGVDILFFTLDASYEIGLSPFFADSDERNNMFTLSAGVKF